MELTHCVRCPYAAGTELGELINGICKMSSSRCRYDLIRVSLSTKTAKYYFPGDHAVQNGETFKHFETRF